MTDENVLCIKDAPLEHMAEVCCALIALDNEVMVENELAFYIPRSKAETDETYRQVIPYVVFENHDNGQTKIFVYERGHGVGEKVMVYGNTWDLSEWLDWRYRCFKRNNALTVITTNFANRQNIADQYGERIKSRMMEMCDAVKYSHTDRREEINRRRYETQRKN